jgi:hypothetical protein
VNTVFTDDIRNGHVRVADIAANAVRTSEINANAVGASELAADAVEASEVAADAVGASELANDAVERNEIATSAVGPDELEDLGTTSGVIANVTPGNDGLSTASCPAGWQIISVGYSWDQDIDGLTVTDVDIDSALNQAKVTGFNNTGANHTLTSRAFCMHP